MARLRATHGPGVWSTNNRGEQVANRGVTILARIAFASGHTRLNTPDPIRTRKLSNRRPGQYWGGGPPGKSLGCCWLFAFALLTHTHTHTHTHRDKNPKTPNQQSAKSASCNLDVLNLNHRMVTRWAKKCTEPNKKKKHENGTLLSQRLQRQTRNKKKWRDQKKKKKRP